MFEDVLKKGKIGAVELKNRFVMPAMGRHTEPDGVIRDEFVEYYAARARGGFGLVIIEYVGVALSGMGHPDQLKIFSDEFIPGFKRVADAVHAGGAKVFLQIQHSGSAGDSQLTGRQLVSSSAIASYFRNEAVLEISNREVYDLIEKFGDAALRAKKAGYDGVELHGGHGYLVAQFLSAYVNRRIDEFGGDITGRARFATDIIKNIKQKCGADFPVSVRLSGEEMVDGGMKLNETQVMARLLEKAGADAFNITVGAHTGSLLSIAPYRTPAGFNTYAAEAIKKAVKVPVIAVGRITDPAMADAVIGEGMADFVGMGRASIADPELPNKVLEGRVDEISPCVCCMTYCITGFYAGNFFPGEPCAINPFAGHETVLKVEPAKEKKTIVIVGGGVAGLEAAWLSASRGHKVILLEKNGKPGGQAYTASVPPNNQGIVRAIKYYITMCKKHGVDIRLNTEATADMVVSLAPDAVILSTGAIPKGLRVPNDGIAVAQAADVLNGEVIPGNNVLVVGGGIRGLKTADFLLTLSKSVTVAEMLDIAGEELGDGTRYVLLKALRDGGVNILTSTKVERFTTDGAVCSAPEGETRLSGYDSVVLAVGAQPYNPLEKELEGKVPEIHVIGDAVEARRIRNAVWEGAELAVRI